MSEINIIFLSRGRMNLDVDETVEVADGYTCQYRYDRNDCSAIDDITITILCFRNTRAFSFARRTFPKIFLYVLSERRRRRRHYRRSRSGSS